LSLFDPRYTTESLNNMNNGTLAEQLGIEFIEVGPDFISAKMPVDHRTRQPLGLLHGGASVALAETLGSVAAYGTLDMSKQHCVGLEINANHIKSAREGYVTGKAFPIHIGRKTQLWQIDIRNEALELVCISRITLMILDK
jgi:1,4-dihydroxy-2-naphthoyl-CoA hydrolase